MFKQKGKKRILMKKIFFNFKTDKYTLYYDDSTQNYYLIDQTDDYLYIAKGAEMQQKINEIEQHDIVLLDGSLIV